MGFSLEKAQVFVKAVVLFSGSVWAAPPLFQLTAEKSGFLETARFEEAERVGRLLVGRYPKLVKRVELGRTSEGRQLFALEVGAQVQAPTVFVIAGIHAGEIEGKDAGLIFLRDLLASQKASFVFSRIKLVFVPVFNVDGHERFGPNNRPNQVGPKDMGFRTNAQNLNLNRDWAKADSPEMRGLLKYWTSLDPVLSVDLHTTDGAKFQHDIAVLVEPALALPNGAQIPSAFVALTQAGGALSAQVMKELKSKGHLPLPFYPSFEVDDDPSSGVENGLTPPRLSQGYAASRNRLGVLVETHSWKTYKERLVSTLHTLEILVDRVVAQGVEWQKIQRANDAYFKSLSRGEPPRFPLWYKADRDVKETIDFLGYAYERVESPVSGRKETVYDDRKPEVWKMPYWGVLKEDLTIDSQTLPFQGGYVVRAGYSDAVVERLKVHGVHFAALSKGIEVECEAYHGQEFEFAKAPFEGRTTLTLKKGAYAKRKLQIPKGSVYIPLAQPAARLLVHLFEPMNRDSFLTWGFFNTAFERKEYIEPYVAHEWGVKILAENPALKSGFEERLKTDPEFAKSPERRMDFFYERHPSWDPRYREVPVYRCPSEKPFRQI